MRVTWITRETINLYKKAVEEGTLYYRTPYTHLVKIKSISKIDWAGDFMPEDCAVWDDGSGKYCCLEGNDPDDYVFLKEVK